VPAAKEAIVKLAVVVVVSVLLVVAAITLADPGPADEHGRQFDQDLARLLVKLELRTRAVIAKHYVGADEPHREWLARNLLLPAAVADNVFHEVVPDATEGRAWVKMIVDEPRNPNNVGDDVTLALLNELREGNPRAERSTDDAYYYGEPISAAKGCLACHGGPRGEPDPFFPQYEKNGWQVGQVVGAVVARVSTEQRD
jgi:methyl-accepting chemotaxis protein